MGHATSPDMIHWTEQDRALRPFGDHVKNRYPAMADKNCFSGSGNVDVNNTAGWQRGDQKTMVVALTDTGCGESLAYSNDRGKTWKMVALSRSVGHESICRTCRSTKRLAYRRT